MKLESLGGHSVGSDYSYALGIREPRRALNVHSSSDPGRDSVTGCRGSSGSQVPIDASSPRVQSQGRSSSENQ